MFFALSAFLFYRSFAVSKLITKFKSRFRSLVIPYLIWNGISMVIFYFLAKLPFINTEPFSLTLPKIVDSLIFYRYNLVFWFVFNLILLTYLFPLMYPILKSKIASAVVFAVLLYVYGWKFRVYGHLELRALIFYFFSAFFAVQYEEAVVKNNRVCASKELPQCWSLRF